MRRYGQLPNRHSGAKQEQPSGGKTRREAHPNGGEVARIDIPRAKMPENSSSTPIHHTPLKTDLGKMPKQMSAPRQRDPHRR